MFVMFDLFYPELKAGQFLVKYSSMKYIVVPIVGFRVICVRTDGRSDFDKCFAETPRPRNIQHLGYSSLCLPRYQVRRKFVT